MIGVIRPTLNSVKTIVDLAILSMVDRGAAGGSRSGGLRGLRSGL